MMQLALRFVLIILLLAIVACSQQRLNFKPSIKEYESINLCVTFDERIHAASRPHIEKVVNEFITTHNEQNSHEFALLNCQSTKAHALTVHISKQTVPNVGKQVLITTLGGLGVMALVQGAPVFWILWPYGQIHTFVKPSDDINSDNSYLQRSIGGMAYGSQNSLYRKQANYLKPLLHEVVKQIRIGREIANSQ